MHGKNVIIPLPSYGFDPTEAAIPWKVLKENNIEVFFATPNGKVAEADKIILTGKGLGIWKWLLQARQDAGKAYQMMSQDSNFKNPISYSALNDYDFDGILLPGGHDKGVIEYLESKELQYIIACFFEKNKPVAAICHGVILASRSKISGKSVLFDYKTTALLKSQEKAAYNLTRLWLKDYYLTYPGLTVEDEVKSVLKNPKNFITGPTPMFRDDFEHLERGFTVLDRNFLSARWPGDAFKFALDFVSLLTK